MPDANQTVETTLDRANRVYTAGHGTTLGILKEADANLSQRLHALVRRPGAKDLRFSEAQALAYRQQIQLVTAYTEKRLLGHTHEQAKAAIAVGYNDTVRLLKKLEVNFNGMAQPLQLESQAMQDHVLRGTGSSLIRQHQASWQRYGAVMTGDFERVLRTGALEGLSQHQVISRLVSTGELGGINAQTLHAQEPGYFPKPTGYVVRRYWAERIVRTEQAYALNAANERSIATAKRVDFPDMQKKILAHFDNRTAPDSIAVHGQIREVEGMFVDGAGRRYKHPPARPNDRETVIPWRPHWTELPATHPPPPEAVAEAQVAAESGLAPASMGHNPVQASNAKIVALVEKAKAERAQVAETRVIAQRAQAAAQPIQLQATQRLGAAQLVSPQALAQAQRVNAAVGVRVAQTTALAKAQREAQAAAQAELKQRKLAEAQAAQRAAVRARATFTIQQLRSPDYAEPNKALAARHLVERLRELEKTRPELYAEMLQQAGVVALPGASSAKVANALGKRISPDLFKTTPKPKATKADATEKDFADLRINLRVPMADVHAVSRSLFGEPMTPELFFRVTANQKDLPGVASADFSLGAHGAGTDRPRLAFGAVLRNDNGADLAAINRRMMKDGDKLEVYNDLFVLDKSVKGGGYGRKIIAKQVSEYRRLGVKRIEVHAAWDGQYVWPRMGYRLKEPGKLRGLQRELLNYVGHETYLAQKHELQPAGVARDLAAQVERATTAHELAIITHDGRAWGKEFLLKRGNAGADLIDLEMPVVDGDPNFEIMKKYLELK